MIARNRTENDERLAYRLHEAAAIVGVSPRTLRRWIRAGLLPQVSIGGYRGVLRKDLLETLRQARSGSCGAAARAPDE